MNHGDFIANHFREPIIYALSDDGSNIIGRIELLACRHCGSLMDYEGVDLHLKFGHRIYFNEVEQ